MAKWEEAPVVGTEVPGAVPKWQEAPVVEEKSFMEKLVEAIPEVGRVLARGGKEAVMGIPNLVEQGAEAMIPEALKAQGERPDLAPGFVPLQERAGQAIESATTPQTRPGQAISNIIAAALAARTGGGALGAGGKLGAAKAVGAGWGGPVGTRAGYDLAKVTPEALNLMTRVGTASGVGGELAGAATGDDPVSRVAGSLAGGLGYGLVGGTLRGAGNLIRGQGRRIPAAKEITAGLTEEDIAQSLAAQQLARSQGVGITPGQTLPGTNVPPYEAYITGQKIGTGLTDTFRQQPRQVAGLVQRFEQGVPGRDLPASPLNTQAKQAATSALKTARTQRRTVTSPLYTGEISKAGAKSLQKTIKDEIKKLPTELDDVKALQKLRLALTNKVTKTLPDGTVKVKRVPLTRTQDINKAFRSVKNSLAKPGEGGKQFSKEVRNKVERVINDLKAQIGEEVSDYAKADELFASISRRVVNPMKEGPAGKIAGQTEYIPGQPTASNYLTRLFDQGVSGKGASEIELARKQLLKGGPEGKVAFDDTFKSWFAKGLSDSMKFEKGGVSPDIAKSIHAKFFGTEAKRQAFRDGLRGVAKNNNLDVDKTIKGMENMVRTIEMAATKPAAVGLSGGEIASEADTIAKQISGLTYLLPARGVLRKLNQALRDDALKFVSDTLSTPGGIEKLYKLANANPGSRTAQTILGDLAATGVQPELAQPEER